MKTHTYITKIVWMLVCTLLLMFTTAFLSFAQSSLNYQLVRSVADQAGAPSQSTTYEAVNAMGQPSPVGVTSSTNYIITSGFISGRINHLSTSSDSDFPAPYEDFQLFQNYPNPFTTSTTIRFSLPEAGHVVLGIYSILGKHIATLFNEYRSPGFYYVSYNGTTLSPGVYIYKIQTPQFQAVKMMSRME